MRPGTASWASSTGALIVGQIHQRIPGAQWVLFEQSSHMPHVEEPDAFLDAVETVLLTID